MCSNFAFFALLALFVPFAVDRLRLAADVSVATQAAFGLGGLAASIAAPTILARFEPRIVLVAGPALSLAAALALATADARHGAVTPLLAFALLGFGPMLWLICQTTLRQLVTPPAMLGRVSAAIQTAIYGVRPLGALADRAGLAAALMMVVATFAASTLVAALSPLARLRALPIAIAAVR